MVSGVQELREQGSAGLGFGASGWTLDSGLMFRVLGALQGHLDGFFLAFYLGGHRTELFSLKPKRVTL